MPQITGEEVWAAMQLDKKFMAQFVSQAMIDVAKPYMLETPNVLKDLLDKKVSLSTILEAKIIFLKNLFSSDYVDKMVKIMPDRTFILFNREQIVMQSKMMFSSLADTLDKSLILIPQMLEARGITERQYMININGYALRPDVLKLYEEDKLTIEDLLKLQPGVILNNQ